MATPPPFKLDAFEFRDESWQYLSTPTHLRVFSFFGLTPPFLPVKFKKRRGLRFSPNLVELGEAIGCAEAGSNDLLTVHKRRLQLRFVSMTLAYVFMGSGLVLILGVPLMYILIRALRAVDPNSLTDKWIALSAGLAYLVMFFVGMLAGGIVFKITSVVVDRYFADSLSILNVIVLNILLSREDALTRPNRKVEVLQRLHLLARSTQLLSLRYFSRDPETQEWIRSHFNHFAEYIRQRERWATAPRETTLLDLQRDIYELASVCISGRYGDFHWAAEERREEPSLTWRQQMARGVPRLFGLLIPLTIALVFVWQRAYFEKLGLTTNVVALVLLAWFLLALDSALKLGIVANLVSLAKGIKELK